MTVQDVVEHEGAPDQDLLDPMAAFDRVSAAAAASDASLGDVIEAVSSAFQDVVAASRCELFVRRTDGRFVRHGFRRLGRSDGAPVLGGRLDLLTHDVVRTGSAVRVADVRSDDRVVNGPLKGWARHELIAFPLAVQGDVIAVVCAADGRRREGFTAEIDEAGTALARMVALAVHQAWQCHQLNRRTHEAEGRRRSLDAATEVCRRLARVVLDGGTIDASLELICDGLGRPVVLYGPSWTEIACAAPAASGARNPGLPAALRAAPWMRKALAPLRGETPVVVTRATPDTTWRRMVAAMYIDGRCVGYLEVCELGRAFDEVDREVVAQASLVLTTRLAGDARALERRRHARGRDLVAIARREGAERVAVDRAEAARRYLLLRLQYATSSPGTMGRRDAGVLARLDAAVDETAQRLDVASVGDADLVLFEVEGADGAEAGERLLEAGRAVLADSDLRYVLVSGLCENMDEIATQADVLAGTARLLDRCGSAERCLRSDELEVVQLMARHGWAEVTQRALSWIEPLREYDERSGGLLVETLRRFVTCDGQVRPTALAMGVHENTVRYRLSRIGSLSTIRPERLEGLMRALLAFQVLDLAGEFPPAGEPQIKAAG